MGTIFIVQPETVARWRRAVWRVWRCGEAEEIPAMIGMADTLGELVEKRVIALD
jgi:hypothetical protein